MSRFSHSDDFVCSETLVIPAADEFVHEKLCDPWHRFSAATNDMIVLVEFSEIDGPKPLLTIPERLDNRHFDCADFAVRVMTADYQACNSRASFSLRQDMQMVLTMETQGIATYVHYFTLYDIEARGYVRPYSLAYVSPDRRKIMRLFQPLKSAFVRLLDSLKSCNLRQFLRELRDAADVIDRLENQAISAQYGFYYDSESSSQSTSRKQDILNLKYMRLHQDVNTAISALTSELRSPSSPNVCHLTHEIALDKWLARLLADGSACPTSSGSAAFELKDLSQLAPCVYKELCFGLQALLTRLTRAQPEALCAGLRFGDVLTLALPGSAQTKRDDEQVRLAGDAPRMIEHDEAQKKLLVSLLPSLPQILYPALSGKFMLICGSDLRRHTATAFVEKLRDVLPSSPNTPCAVINWHRGTVPASALAEYKLFAQRLTRNENLDSFLSPEVRRFVTVLDLNHDILHSSRYVGTLLGGLPAKEGFFTSDRALIAYVRSLLVDFCSSVYVLYYHVFADADSYRRNIRSLRQFAARLGVEKSDLKMLRYLIEIVKEQRTGDVSFSGLQQESLFLGEEKTQVLKL